MDEELEAQRVLAKKLREFFSSSDEAAISALNKISDKQYETGGIIFSEGDKFFASEPQGQKKAGQFQARVTIPAAAKLAGIYHSHPGRQDDSDAELFSTDDIDVANRMKMLSFIKALDSGNIRKYEPGKSRTRPHSRTDRRTVSEGELLKQQVIAAALQAAPIPGSER